MASTATQALTWTPKPNNDDDDEPEDRATENRKVNAHSLAETLLIALNIPFDEHAEEAEPVPFAIQPPITAAKVAAQIAQVSNALLAGTIAADQAKAVLFALQTMLTAIRVNVMEQKNRTDTPAHVDTNHVGTADHVGTTAHVGTAASAVQRAKRAHPNPKPSTRKSRAPRSATPCQRIPRTPRKTNSSPSRRKKKSR